MLIPENMNSRLWNYTNLGRFRDMLNFAVLNQFFAKLYAITTVSFTVKRAVIHRQAIYGLIVRGSVHHSIIHIKIQQDATVYQNLFYIYMKLNMFRATRRPSSGA